jgi:hypothetical protein
MTTKASPHLATIADLEKKHGKIAHLVLDGELLAFRRPELEEWEAYQEDLGKRPRGVCYRQLALVTILSPTTEKLNDFFARYPALNARIADAVTELAGANLEFTVKKD